MLSLCTQKLQAPDWRQQYPQQGSGLDQWAAVRQPLPQQQWRPEQWLPPLPHRMQPPPWGGQEEQQQLAARREREMEEDRLVAATCPHPALQAVRESFPTQREAFAATDRHNRCMPLLRQPAVVPSNVQQGELLPLGAAAAQHAASSSSHSGCGSGSTSSGAGGGAGAAQGQPGPGQEAESACAQQQQQQQSPADFLSRFRPGALPLVDSSGYNMSPLLKRQRAAAAEEEARPQQDEEQEREREAARRSAMQQYQALLRAQAQASAAAEQEQQRQQQHAATAAGIQQAGPAQAATGSEGSGVPDAPAVGGAGGAVPAPAGAYGMEGLHEEAVRCFCVERRGR